MRRTFFYSIIAALLIVALSTGVVFAIPSETTTDSQPVFINPAIIKTKKELDDLAEKIKSKEAEVQELGGQLESSTKEIISSYQRLKSAERDLRDQQTVLNKRIIEVYKNRSNFIILVLTSRSLRDLWTRITFLSRVNQVDRSLLSKNKKHLDKVDNIRNTISAKKEGLLESRRARISELADLRIEFNTKNTKLSTLTNAAKPAKTVNSQTSFSILGR